MTTTDILKDLALELLALKGVQVSPDATFSEAMELIKRSPLELPEAKRLEIDPPKNPDDLTFLVAQALLWLAANKNTLNEKPKLEQQLAKLIRDGSVNVSSIYYGYSLLNLICRAGSEVIADAAMSVLNGLETMEMCDEIDFSPPDEEWIRVSAVKSGCPAVIHLVEALCHSISCSGIVNPIFLSELEDLIAIENDTNAKLALQQGLAICNGIMQVNRELEKIENERRADEAIRSNIRNGNLSAVSSYIGSPDNANKLKSLLDFAINENKHSSIFSIAQRMQTLGMMNEYDLLNLCAKHIPHSQLYELVKVHPSILSPNLTLDALNNESIKFLIKYFPEDYKKLVDTVARRPLKNLLDDDLLLDLFMCSEQTRISIMKNITALSPNDLVSLVTQGNSLVLLSCALASGVSPANIHEITGNNKYDLLSIMLLAASYPGSQFNIETIKAVLKGTDQESIIVTGTHLFLAKKFNAPDLHETILKRYKKNDRSFSEVEIEDITHLQGALRVFNRAKEVYPTFFGKQETYQYWMHTKSKARHDELLKNPVLAYLALKYIDSHCVPNYPYGMPLFLPVNSTSQYVKQVENYKSIMEAACLLSETARTNVGMKSMPTMIDNADRAMRDQDLVCTAPFKTAFNTGKHFCGVNFNLGKMPPAYLRHAVIKLGDYVARKRVPIHIQLTPEITLDNEYQNPDRCNYTFTYKDESDTVHSVTVSIPGADEIYHGVNGFKESLCHIFYVINSLPATPEGLLIKSKITEHFSQLAANGRLKDELDLIFQKLNEYMEIDFPGGLPLSFKYVDSIHFIETNTTFKIDELYSLIDKGELNDFKEFFRKYPQFKDKPFIIREILALAPAYRLHEVTQILEAISPASYFALTENLIDLMNLSRKALQQSAAQSSLHGSNSTQFDLAGLITHLKTTLAGSEFAATRQQLMRTHEKDVLALRDQIRKLYDDVQYTGNNSKMREVLTNPDIICALTGKNQALLAAILAFEIEAELESKPCDATFIRSAKSQQSGEFIHYTLGSILSGGLALPQFFIASCPLNTKEHTLDEAKTLRACIQQRSFTEKLLLKIESTLVGLCQSYEPDINLDRFLMTDDAHHMLYNPEGWQHNEYLFLLENMYAPISEKDFCANPHVPSEINEGLATLIHALYPNEKPLIEENPNLIVLSEISCDRFIKDFLSTSHILNPKISHFLFDTLHFGVALTGGDSIAKIQLNDATLSFKDLIEQAMKTINQAGVNPTNSIMAEQLALRTKMLESWCIENKKELSPQGESTLRLMTS